MDFTREPIIETIITPKEGCKLVVRSSKSAGQEEYFVEALEIVSFGHALFFRSLERPKAFFVPVSDYEVLEVRETRIVLKNAGLDRSIKIGGGREAGNKVSREQEKNELFPVEDEKETILEEENLLTEPILENPVTEPRLDKKRDRRRNYRKRRGKEDKEEASVVEPSISLTDKEKIFISPPLTGEEVIAHATVGCNLFSSLLQPPPTLISETINRYRENALFKNAFFLADEEQYKPHHKVQDLLNEEDENNLTPHLQTPTFVEDFLDEKEEKHFPVIQSKEEERGEKENKEQLSFLDSIEEKKEEDKQELDDSSKELNPYFDHLVEKQENYLTSNKEEEPKEEKANLPLYAEEEFIQSGKEEEIDPFS